jgi:hypothetical protein
MDAAGLRRVVGIVLAEKGSLAMGFSPAPDTQAATQHSNLDDQRSVRYPRNHLRSSMFLPNLVVQGRDRCHGIYPRPRAGRSYPTMVQAKSLRLWKKFARKRLKVLGSY